jgi:hypothetical protein
MQMYLLLALGFLLSAHLRQPAEAGHGDKGFNRFVFPLPENFCSLQL